MLSIFRLLPRFRTRPTLVFHLISIKRKLLRQLNLFSYLGVGSLLFVAIFVV